MKKISIIIYLLLCTFLAFGQTGIQIVDNPLSFSPNGEEFSVASPTSFTSQSFSKDNSSRRYFYQSDKTYLFIFVEERKTQAKNNLGQFKNVIGFVRDYQSEGVKGRFGEDEAEKYEFVDSEGFFHKVLLVKTYDFVQIFQTVSETKDDSLAQNFFTSIKIKGNSSTLVNLSNPSSIEKPIEVVDSEKKTKVVSDEKGLGNGSGNENRGGNGIGASQPAKSQTMLSTPLLIKTKSAPPYTNDAKFYEIQGSISLRVTFNANGTIGSVVPTTKLPFGLTSNAIEAAKKVTFEPATKNGVPVTVTKTLQYHFTLY